MGGCKWEAERVERVVRTAGLRGPEREGAAEAVFDAPAVLPVRAAEGVACPEGFFEVAAPGVPLLPPERAAGADERLFFRGLRDASSFGWELFLAATRFSGLSELPVSPAQVDYSTRDLETFSGAKLEAESGAQGALQADGFRVQLHGEAYV
jgi:hypothetical protein